MQFDVNEYVISWIHKIIFVTHSFKSFIENYFDTNFELAGILKKYVKRKIIIIGLGNVPCNLMIMQVWKNFLRGLGYAVLYIILWLMMICGNSFT